jgi:hypothetical protein
LKSLTEPEEFAPMHVQHFVSPRALMVLPTSVPQNPIQDFAVGVIMPVHENSCGVLERSFHTALELRGREGGHHLYA